MELKEIKEFIEKLDQNNISFDSHIYKRSRERPINEGMIRNFLYKANKLEKVEHGKGKNRFKLWFKMSSKYSLVLVVEVNISKGLKVISAWNTYRKWQLKLRR